MKSYTLLVFTVLALTYVEGYAFPNASINDIKTKVTIEETIVQQGWRNLHTYIFMEEDTNGSSNIQCTSSPPSLELNEEETQLRYRFEFKNSEYIAEPVTGEIQWTYGPDYVYESLFCDPDSVSRFAR